VAARLCVFCRRHAVQPAWQPFCSERCKLQDLAKWVDGDYRIPAEPLASDDPEGPDGDGDTGNHS
jgi:endogenous inhibitor of DNA gyrase (YacG/DUF329 family)